MLDKELNPGEVAITLDGEQIVLKPTLEACLAISNHLDGLATAADRVTKFDVAAAANIIALALDPKATKTGDLPKKIYDAGMADLVAPLVSYITVLANGGRPVKPSAPAA